MNRRTLMILPAVVLALSAMGCGCGLCGLTSNFGTGSFGWPGTVRGSGRVVEEERPISGVDGVVLATLGNLTIKVGDEEELRIEAEENLIPYFETEVRNGTLFIRQRNNARIAPRKPVNFYLTVVELESIELTGSGDAEAADLEAKQFSATLTGSGDLNMESLDAESLDVRINGSGGIRLEDLRADRLSVRMTGSGDLDIIDGRVEEQSITITGSGGYEAGSLASAEAEVQLTGSGSATIQVDDRLNASTSGSGDVRYIGNPTVNRSSTGSGDVVPIGD